METYHRIYKLLFILILVICCSVKVQGQEAKDSRITRVRPLSAEEKLQVPPRDSGRSLVYLANLIPAPVTSSSSSSSSSSLTQDSNDIQGLRDPARNTPALFLLQPVRDDQNLPDGIYYRPGQGEKDPPPVIQKDISRLHAFILGRTPRARRQQNKTTQ